MPRISRSRLLWVALGAVVLLGAAVWAGRVTASPAAAGPLPAAVTGLPQGRAAGAVTTGRGSPLISYPTWCCSTGSPLGLTVTGQATARGTGSAARVTAIARATADAAGQAKAAAGAAGIALGKIVNMQVSASSYPYPVPLGAASGTPGPAGSTTGPAVAGGQGGAPSPGLMCPEAAQCPGYPGASTSATVTITWAIA